MGVQGSNIHLQPESRFRGGIDKTDMAPVLEIMSTERSSDRSGRKNCLVHRHISFETLRVSSFLKQDG